MQTGSVRWRQLQSGRFCLTAGGRALGGGGGFPMGATVAGKEVANVRLLWPTKFLTPEGRSDRPVDATHITMVLGHQDGARSATSEYKGRIQLNKPLAACKSVLENLTINTALIRNMLIGRGALALRHSYMHPTQEAAIHQKWVDILQPSLEAAEQRLGGVQGELQQTQWRAIVAAVDSFERWCFINDMPWFTTRSEVFTTAHADLIASIVNLSSLPATMQAVRDELISADVLDSNSNNKSMTWVRDRGLGPVAKRQRGAGYGHGGHGGGGNRGGDQRKQHGARGGYQGGGGGACDGDRGNDRGPERGSQ